MASFIYQDSENGNPSTKLEGALLANPTKRTALGVITNQSRIHPAKLTRQPPVKQCQDFIIYQDENVAPNKISEKAAHVKAKHHEAVLRNVCVPTLKHDVGEQTAAQLLCNPAFAVSGRANVRDDEFRRCTEERLESPMLLDQSQTGEHTPVTLNSEERQRLIVDMPEYSDDIYAHLREAERRFRPKAGYMRKQPDINESMRCILVDWLVEVAEEYKLHRETLFLAVGYVDRFLSQMSVQRGKLQLVGTASMYLAAKFEEVCPPEAREFVYITDDTYTRKQVLRMEHLILKVLSFDVAAPTVSSFCERLMRLTDADDETYAMTMYLAELSLVSGEVYCAYLPSVIATAAACLANHVLGRSPPWPDCLSLSSLYTFADIEPCLRDLRKTLREVADHPQQAVRHKYRQAQFHCVSNYSLPIESTPELLDGHA